MATHSLLICQHDQGQSPALSRNEKHAKRGLYSAWLNFNSLKVDHLVHQMETPKSGKHCRKCMEVWPLPDMITAREEV